MLIDRIRKLSVLPVLLANGEQAPGFLFDSQVQRPWHSTVAGQVWAELSQFGGGKAPGCVAHDGAMLAGPFGSWS